MTKSQQLLAAIVVAIVLIGAVSYAVYQSRVDKFRPGDQPEQIEVTWQEAIEILNSGEVEQVVQLHSLEVEFMLHNGTRIVTMEPNIDDIFREVEACGRPCEDIILATE